MNHFGDLDELKSAVESCGLKGNWTENADTGLVQFRANRTGEILNWWPSTGTVAAQGKNQQKFSDQLSVALEQPSINITSAPAEVNRKIFVVHGHDVDAREQLELVLMRLGVQPFILQNSDGGGKTIIEALEQHVYKESAFGIVLLTPDDYGYSKDKPDADRQPRARQNVILELGMVLAALGRDRMVILKKGALEMPSDINGILYVEFNTHVKEVATKLAQRLASAGFEISPSKIVAASQ